MTIRVEHTEIINLPLENVWTYAMDVDCLRDWQPGIVETWNEGPEGLGQRRFEKRRFMGMDMDSEMECIEYEPLSRVTTRVINGPVVYDTTNIYEEVEGGTVVTTIIEGEPGGFFGSLAAPMLKAQLKKEMEDSWGRLKAIMER